MSLIRCAGGLACGTLVDPARGMCRDCARRLGKPMWRHAYTPTVQAAPSDPDFNLSPSTRRKDPR